jgi:hypothetical protein
MLKSPVVKTLFVQRVYGVFYRGHAQSLSYGRLDRHPPNGVFLERSSMKIALFLRLKTSPHDHDANVIQGKAGDGIQVFGDAVGRKIAPAIPPVFRWRIIDAKPMLVQARPGGFR